MHNEVTRKALIFPIQKPACRWTKRLWLTARIVVLPAVDTTRKLSGGPLDLSAAESPEMQGEKYGSVTTLHTATQLASGHIDRLVLRTERLRLR